MGFARDALGLAPRSKATRETGPQLRLVGKPYSAPPSAHRFPARPWSEAQAERGATIAVRGVTTPVAQMRMRPPANAKAPPAPSGSARKKGTGGGGAPEKGTLRTRLEPRGQCEVSLFEHRPGGERYMTERALNAPAFQGQRFANACQARNAVLALALAEAGVRIRLIAVRGPCWNVIWPRSRQGSAFRAVTLAAEGDREPRAAEAPSAALFRRWTEGLRPVLAGWGAAMFLSVNWRPRFADPSLLRY